MSIEIPAWVNGTLTPVDKLEAHVRGLRHKAVSVFVTRGREVLIQRRASTTRRASGRIPAAPIRNGTKAASIAPCGGLTKSLESAA